MFLVAATAFACAEKEIDYSKWYADDNNQQGGAQPTVTPEDIDLSVMSFNVRYPAAEDTGDKAWNYRCKGIHAMIKEKKPMIIGLQECYITQRNNITQNCPGYLAYGVGRNDGNQSGETTSILFDKSIFTLKDNGTFWLSENPNKPSIGWDASTYRTTTWVKLEMKSNGQQILVVNTHLDHAGTKAKSEGLKLIQQKINDLNPTGLPVVLTGDFNDVTTSSIFSVLTLKDARKEAKITDNFGTSNGWGNKAQQIDHIFYGNMDVASYQTIRDRWEGISYISDHFPIMATFTFNK